MFQLGQLAGRGFALEHRHSDGSWSPLEPGPEHHDPAQHDPERDWQHGRFFVCKVCGEEVRVTTTEALADPDELSEGA
jgi:hypothetical protein